MLVSFFKKFQFFVVNFSICKNLYSSNQPTKLPLIRITLRYMIKNDNFMSPNSFFLD